MPNLAEIPVKIDWLVPEIQADEGFAKHSTTNKCFPFNWPYLKINICECDSFCLFTSQLIDWIVFPLFGLIGLVVTLYSGHWAFVPLKGTSHDSIFQFSLFPTVADILAV